MDAIESRGHEITADWTKHKPLESYPDNAQISMEYAAEDLKGVRNCDAFIMVSDPEGTGIYIELGAAIALGKKVFMIGPHTSHSVFFLLPQIKIVENLEEVFKELNV